jgi:hypothetical protein
MMDDKLVAAILASRQKQEAETPAQRDQRWRNSEDAKPDKNGFVSFGSVAGVRCNKDTQYCVCFVDVRFCPQYPDLGKGLKFSGDMGQYHELRIHIDDVDEFVRRYRKYRNS